MVDRLLALAMRSDTIQHCVTVLCERRLNHTPLFGNHLREAWRCLNGR